MNPSHIEIKDRDGAPVEFDNLLNYCVSHGSIFDYTGLLHPQDEQFLHDYRIYLVIIASGEQNPPRHSTHLMVGLNMRDRTMAYVAEQAAPRTLCDNRELLKHLYGILTQPTSDMLEFVTMLEARLL